MKHVDNEKYATTKEDPKSEIKNYQSEKKLTSGFYQLMD